MVRDERLLDYATERQAECLEMYWKAGSARAAGKELGIQHSAILKAVKAVKAKAALKGYVPEMHISTSLPEFLKIKGTSQLIKRDEPEPLLTWVKTNTDGAALGRIIESFMPAYLEGFEPLPEIAPPRVELDTDIIPWFNIGDAHIGMLAHANEVGHNFDLKIAERELVTAMRHLIARAPSSERCVIQDLGDMSHYQDFTAKSESGHDFDFDSRYPKMIETCARVMRAIVDEALAKYRFVDVIVNQGNHSRSNDVWMRVFLNHVYSNNDRLHVLDNSSVFIPYRMGNTFVMCHHSDKCRPAQLAHVMATDFAKDWGESIYRYIDIGHIHHRMTSKEHPGVTVESWNQLAPSDKYAHDGGWRSRACLTCVLRSKTYGEKGRITISAEEVKDVIAKAQSGTEALKRRAVYSV